jgi:enhancing lycopene biosynthesis protein 2
MSRVGAHLERSGAGAQEEIMAEKPRVAVVLSGCGYLDGSEIHEAVALLYHLARSGATSRCFAPDTQLDEVDHLTGQPTGAKRSVLREAARIARGEIARLEDLDPDDFEALAFPGGFGAAKNLSDFARAGGSARALDDVVRVVRGFRAQRKPIAVACIAPAMLAAALHGSGVSAKLTVGATSGASAGVEALGARHEACSVDGIVVDAENRIVSTPAYMYDAPITGPFEGIGKMVDALLGLMRG